MINKTIKNSLQANYLLELASKPLEVDDIFGELIPPKHFDEAQFSNYIPEPDYPSQKMALDSIKQFISEIKKNTSKGIFSRFIGRTFEGRGLYLDGGFGVGKTHLLASAFHTFQGQKAYLSFQELMFLVGLQSLNGVVAMLKDIKLLVIDEFELDDPANTRITTNLLGQLFDNGVSILTSSNTPPGALGTGKFSVEDFERELGDLTKRFEVLKIDGEDYRTTHKLDTDAGSSWIRNEEEFDKLLSSELLNSLKIIDSSFDEFLAPLAKVHPMRIRKAIGKVDAVILRDIKQISHPHEALRFVYFIDKAYDNNLLLIGSSGVGIEAIFQKSYFTGGDTKKFLRTISRLKEMTAEAYKMLGSNI